MKVHVESEEKVESKTRNLNEKSVKVSNVSRNLMTTLSVGIVRVVGVSIYLLLSGLVAAMVYNALVPYSNVLSVMNNAYFTVSPQMQVGAVAVFSMGLFIIHLGGNSHNITNKKNLSEIGASTMVFALIMGIGFVVSMVVSLPLDSTLMIAGAFWLILDTITDFS